MKKLINGIDKLPNKDDSDEYLNINGATQIRQLFKNDLIFVRTASTDSNSTKAFMENTDENTFVYPCYDSIEFYFRKKIKEMI